MRTKICGVIIITVAACTATMQAGATDGYFQHGYGIISKGMAGAGTAVANDTFGGASNPAKMVFVGNRIDFGVDLFSPRRSAERSGSSAALGPIDGSADSDSTLFAVPEFGYNKMIDSNLAVGVSVYGNGGMNTNYPGDQIPSASACAGFYGVPTPGPYNLLCGTGRLGVNLIQLIVAPTLSYKLSENQAIGIAPLFGFQRFKIDGLQAFAGFSTSPGDMTNQGNDTAQGVGFRVGWFGRSSDMLSFGAAYSTKIKMSKFDKYKGLFAEGGDFDMPVNYNAGVAAKVTPETMIVLDYQHINYSGVKSVGNPSALLLQCAGGNLANCLGGSDGAGFGWHDVSVWKLGIEHRYNSRMTLRGGWNHTDNPIRAEDVTINILAPGVVQDHLTLGLTYLLESGGELSFAFMHAFNNSVSGSSFFNNFTGGLPAGNETIQMHQNALGVAYGLKL